MEVVQILLETGANVDAESRLALQKALEKDREVVMRLLLKQKANESLEFQHDGKSLHRNLIHDHEAVIQLLQEKLETFKIESI